MTSKLAAFFDVRPGEGRVAVLTLCLSFCLGVSYMFVFTSSRALFLKFFGAQFLPYAYLGSSAGVLTVGFAFKKLERRLSEERLLILTFGFLCAVTLALRLWLALGSKDWASLALAIWFEILFVLGGISFWGLCGRLFNVRQAKRLYGLIGAGEYLADIAGGVATSLLVLHFGAENLLFISGAGLAGAMGFTALLLRKYCFLTPAPLEEEGDQNGETGGSSLKRLFRDRYVLIIHLVWGLSIVALYLIDAAFSQQAEAHYASEDAMAGFFGLFYAAASAIILAARGALSGRLISKFGVTRTMLVLPAALAPLALLLAALSPFLERAGALAPIFWLAVALRLTDNVLRYCFYKPAFLVLYQPLPRSRRLAVQASVEGMAEPAAALVAAGLLLAGGEYYAFDAAVICRLLLIALLAWVAAGLFLRGEYGAALRRTLALRGLKGRNLALDKAALDVIDERLTDPHPGEILYCLDILEENAPDRLAPRLIGLLGHPSMPTRLEVLARIERLRPEAAREPLLALIRETPPSPAAPAALRAYAAIRESASLEVMLEYMRGTDREMVLGAVVGLTRYCGIEGVFFAGERLIAAQHAEDPAEREFAARALGEIGIANFHRPLRYLLWDESLSVRRAALTAAGKLGNPALVPYLIPNLSHPLVGGKTSRVIAAMGAGALFELEKAFAQNARNRRMLIAVVRTVARIGHSRATAFLAEHMVHRDAPVRGHILKALSKSGYQAASSKEKKIVMRLLRREAGGAAFLLHVSPTVAVDEDCQALVGTLEKELRRAVRRMLALLGFLLPGRTMAGIEKNLARSDPEKRAYAMETLDAMLDAEAKGLVLPILEGLEIPNRFLRIDKRSPHRRLTIDAALVAVVKRKRIWLGDWPKAVAAYAMGKRKKAVYLDCLKEAAGSEDALLRETGVWAVREVEAAMAAHPAADNQPRGESRSGKAPAAAAAAGMAATAEA